MKTFGIILFMALALVVLVWVLGVFETAPSETDTQIDSSGWPTFQKDEFNFTIKYPDGWMAAEDASVEFSPKFNFYVKPAEAPANPPFDHFANITNASVFPKGLPTEGILGETVPIDFGEELQFDIREENSRMYLLENGEPFAAFIRPANLPLGWTESGYIFMRVRADNYEAVCVQGGVQVDPNNCLLPLEEGARIVHRGKTDQNTWETLKTIIKSVNLDLSGSVSDLIKVESLQEGQTISSPLTIKGEARGSWYFEATFPVTLVDWDGKIIAEDYAEAQGEWMTENFAPWNVTLEFESPYSPDDPDFMKVGALIFKKANPSGLPENEAALEVPVTFE